MKITLLIARHGNTFTSSDVVTRVGAHTDLPLVASGLEQGRKLGLYLRQRNLLPGVIYTSALQRTQQTAEQACAAAHITPPIVIRTLFNEVDYGIDENRPEDEVIARLGAEALKAWDEDAIVPNGWQVDVPALIQGWMDFGASLTQDQTSKIVLVVTSNGIARFAPHLTGDFATFRRTHKLKISTGALCHLSYENEKWCVEGWNIKP